MKCDQVIQHLPELVLDTLPHEERAALQQHLRSGCQRCQHEFDQLTSAASAFAETLDPVAPRAELKQALLARLENEPQLAAGSVSLPPSSGQAPVVESRRPYLLYVAASIAALAAGTLIANVTGRTSRQAQVAEATSTPSPQLQRQYDLAQKAFGPPNAQLASFAHSVADESLQVSIYHDQLAEQLHVLVAKAPDPGENQQLWLWILDDQGEVLASGRIDSLEGSRAAGVLKVVSEPRHGLHEAVITSETPGEHDHPSDKRLGRARLTSGV